MFKSMFNKLNIKMKLKKEVCVCIYIYIYIYMGETFLFLIQYFHKYGCRCLSQC